MFKRLFGRTKKPAPEEPASEPQPTKPQHVSHKAPPPTPRLLTAEGWKRLMMKKYRKSS